MSGCGRGTFRAAQDFTDSSVHEPFILEQREDGAGQMVKLVNQILVVVNALAVSEALLFAQAGQLDLSKTLGAVSGGAAGSWMLSNRGPQVVARDWRPGFTIDLQQKDLRLVLDTADQLGVPVIATSLVFNLYRTLQARGLGGEGNHALVKALEQIAVDRDQRSVNPRVKRSNDLR